MTDSAGRRPLAFDDVRSLEGGSPDRVVAYGGAPQQFGELWLPEGRPAAAVVLIHGGCWLNTYGVDHTRPMSRALRERGYAVWAIEYRRIGDAGAGWPGTFQDVSAAIAGLPEDADSRGGGRRILLGHSAGGHLALWAGGRGSVGIAGVVALAPIVDLATYARGSSPCERAVVELLGGPPEACPERYRSATPVRGSCPTILLHGEADTVVPVAQSADSAFADCLRRVGKTGHFDLIHPQSGAWPLVVQALESLCS